MGKSVNQQKNLLDKKVGQLIEPLKKENTQDIAIFYISADKNTNELHMHVEGQKSLLCSALYTAMREDSNLAEVFIEAIGDYASTF